MDALQHVKRIYVLFCFFLARVNIKMQYRRETASGIVKISDFVKFPLWSRNGVNNAIPELSRKERLNFDTGSCMEATEDFMRENRSIPLAIYLGHFGIKGSISGIQWKYSF